MKLDEKALEAGAREEAGWDGRDFDALGRGDKQRYIARLSAAIRAYLEAATPPDMARLIEVLHECSEMVEGGRQDGLTQFWHDETAKLTAKNLSEAATALRLSAGGGWRDAGSVPEDGSVILAYRPDAGVFTAHYVEEDAHLSSLANPPEGDCYWFTTNGDDLTGDMFTHWQPLPVPPTAPAEGA